MARSPQARPNGFDLPLFSFRFLILLLICCVFVQEFEKAFQSLPYELGHPPGTNTRRVQEMSEVVLTGNIKISNSIFRVRILQLGNVS